MVVEVLGARDRKIEQRWGFWLAKPKTDAHRIRFGLVHANDEGGQLRRSVGRDRYCD